MKELFAGKESEEARVARIKAYMESSAFLDVYFFPQEFLDGFVPLAMQVLGGVEPERKAPFSGRNEVRYTVLRVLNKFSLKNVQAVELVHVLNKTLQTDNIPNAILALKAMGSLSRSRMMTGDLVDLHVNALLGIVHDLFGNVDSVDESLVEMSLFAFAEVLGHACALFHRTNYHVIKIDQFLIRVYGCIRRTLENRRFLDLVVHKKAVSIEMCSAIGRLLKLTYEHMPVIPKMSPYYMFVSEIALIAVFYCPADVGDLRREVCFFFSKVCISNKEAFLPVIDKIYTLPFLFSPDTLATNVKGLGVLMEILGYFKESVAKIAYMDFAFRTSEVLLSLLYSCRRFCRGNRGSAGIEEESIGMYIGLLGKVVGAVESMCRCFGSRTAELVELHDFYLRSFYDLCHAFRGIREMAGLVEGDELDELVAGFVSGFKEVVGRIGMLEKSGAGMVVLSTPEIHMLYWVFEESFDVLGKCSRDLVEDFFSILVLIREHIANDIVKHCAERILGCIRESERFFGVWRATMGSVVLGNAMVTHILPRISGSSDADFVKKAMVHIVPFFGNDVKKIRKANVFFMHRLISMLMTSQVERKENFEVLLQIFGMFGSMPEKSSFFQKYIFDNFVRMVEHLMRLYEAQGDEIFIELIFALPISINLVETDIQFLIQPIERGLRLGGGIRARALAILVYVLDFSTPDSLDVWRSILRSVVEGLGSPSTSLICARILGKLKTYHRALIGEDFLREQRDGVLVRVVLDRRHVLPGQQLFLGAVQRIRGEFEEEHRFDSEQTLVRFRKAVRRDGDVGNAFRLVRDVLVKMMQGCGEGYRVEGGEYACSTQSIVSAMCRREGRESLELAQLVYDGLLALFCMYGSAEERDAEELLASVYRTALQHVLGLNALFDADTLVDALTESFGDVGNELSFRIFSMLMRGGCTVLCRLLLPRLEMLCRSSETACRRAGMNGILYLAARGDGAGMHETVFVCVYSYLLAERSGDYGLPLRVVRYILRFRSSGLAIFHFTPFVLGLFDSSRGVVQFSKTVVREILKTHGDLLLRHGEKIFEFLKQEYVIHDRSAMIRHLQVFVFCVQGGCGFEERKMKYLIGKFLDNISANDEWKGADGETKESRLCGCDGECVVNGKRMSELDEEEISMLAVRDAETVCSVCGRSKNEEVLQFANESEELVHWMKEFYLVVIGQSQDEEEIRTSISSLFRLSSGCMEHLRRAHEMDCERTEQVFGMEIAELVAGKVDYRVLGCIGHVYSQFGVAEDPRIGSIVLKILREFKTPKEFAIIAQDSKYSMLARVYELALVLRDQEVLCGEIMDTYIMLDAYVRSYTAQIYGLMVGYVERFPSRFMACVFKKMQELPVYDLCTRLYGDSGALREIVDAMKGKFAERITKSILGAEGQLDMAVFVHAFRFLEVAGYEMRPVDIQAALGVYSDLKSKGRDVTGMKNLFVEAIGRFSAENLELLFKIDPLFVADAIRPGMFSKDLSVPCLKSMLRSVDRHAAGLEGVVESFGDSCHMVIEVFVEAGIRSARLLKHCKENLHNVNLRGVLLYYLCTFEPLYVYFEILFKMSCEDRRYTLYCLEHVVDAFEPGVFEELILVVLRSEVRFKTSVHVLFPLLLSRPVLVSRRIACELVGSVYKLLNFFAYPQQKMAAELFGLLYERLEHAEALRSLYTLLFVNFVHLKADCSGELFGWYDLELDVERLVFSDSINVNNVAVFLETELGSRKREEYKRELVRSVAHLVSPEFSLRVLSRSVVGYLVDLGLWNYRLIPVQLREGTMRHGCELLYNLLCVLCEREMDADMLSVCVSIVRHLFGEHSREEREDVCMWIGDGLERMFGVLSGRKNGEETVREIVRFFVESLRNPVLDVSPIVEKTVFLVSDDCVTLAEKIEILLLLDSRKCREDLLCELCLPVFARYRHAGTDAMDKLQRFFMLGLSSSMREAYADLLDASVSRNRFLRLVYLLKMDWQHCSRAGWAIVRMMVLSYGLVEIEADRLYRSAECGFECPWMQMEGEAMQIAVDGLPCGAGCDVLEMLWDLDGHLDSVLQGLVRMAVEGLGEEQSREVFGVFLGFCRGVDDEGLVGCLVRGLEPVYRHVDLLMLVEILRGGSAWCVLLEYVDDRQKVEVYRRLRDADGFFGMSRAMCSFPETMQAFFLQQVGKTREAQTLYENTQAKAVERRISFDEGEYEGWVDEWTRCAQELQQWDVCYGLGMHRGDHLLSLEAMWHLSDFSSQDDVEAFRTLLAMREDGYEKQFYVLFASLFSDYSSERIRRFLQESVLQLRSYPAGCGRASEILQYIQVAIEMVESEPVFGSRIDTNEALTSIIFRWRDKEPLKRESLRQWSVFSTWRRHVYSRLGGAVGDMRYEERSPALLSPKEMIENSLRIRKDVGVKGVNELARTLNALSGASIEQGFYDVALFNLKNVFDLSSIKIADAFQKVVYELVCLLEKKEYRLGIDQCGSTNIQHFSEAQSSVVFSFKGLFNERLGRASEAEKLYLQSVQICSSVGDNWLTWGAYLFGRAELGDGRVEEAFLALVQAVAHCSGEKARRAMLKIVLLMRRHFPVCEGEIFEKVVREIDAARFVYFVPQLIGLLETKNADLVQTVLVEVSKEHFQAVVNPLRVERERLRREVYPRESDACVQMKRLKMDNTRKAARSVDESRMRFLENVGRVFGAVKDRGFGREFERVVAHLHSSLNSYVFKEEELVHRQLEMILDEAVLHVLARKTCSMKTVLNELMAHVLSSSLSEGLKKRLMDAVFEMQFLCPLENIDSLVRFKDDLRRVVEGAFYRMNRFENSEINLMLHRSVYGHEMFGQHAEIRSSYKNLVKIEMFEPRWSYMHRKKMGSSRVHVRGSDGRVYRYEMRSVSDVHVSEAVLSQMSLLVDEGMRGNVGLSRRGAGLRLFVPVAVSEVLVVELVKESVHGVDDVLENGLRKHGISLDQCVLLYLNQFANIYDEGVQRSSMRMGVGEECPNIRHRGFGESVEKMDVRGIVERQREKYVSGLRSKRPSCLGCDENSAESVNVLPCTYRYEVSLKQRYRAYGKVRGALEMDGCLKRHFGAVYGSRDGFFRFRTNALLAYASNTAFLYSLFIENRQPSNMVFTRDSGAFMNRRVRSEGGKGMGMISPGLQTLFGRDGIEGQMLSVVYLYNEMLEKSDWFRDLLQTMFESLGDHEKILGRVLQMAGRGENGTYNVVSVVSEWMDTFRLAQMDPRSHPWF